MGNKGLGTVEAHTGPRYSKPGPFRATLPLELGAQGTRSPQSPCLLRLLLDLAARAGVREPSLAPANAAATTIIALVIAVTAPVAAAAATSRITKKMASPFLLSSLFPVVMGQI